MNLRQAPLKAAYVTALSLFSGTIAVPANANHLDFTLYNVGNKPIYALYISPARSRAWGQNVLTRDFLDVGESTRITFPGQTNNSPCIYDIMAVLSDRSERKGRFNLCETRSIDVK